MFYFFIVMAPCRISVDSVSFVSDNDKLKFPQPLSECGLSIRNIKTTMLYHKFLIFSEPVQRLGGRSSLQKSAGHQRRSSVFDALPPHLFDIHKVSYEIKTVEYLLGIL